MPRRCSRQFVICRDHKQANTKKRVCVFRLRVTLFIIISERIKSVSARININVDIGEKHGRSSFILIFYVVCKKDRYIISQASILSKFVDYTYTQHSFVFRVNHIRSSRET